jgi:hypothetical protein
MLTKAHNDFTFDAAAHAFWLEGKRIFSSTQILAMANLCDYSFLSADEREYSMARGTSVHWMTQLEDEGALDYRRVPKAMRGYRKAWNLWKERSGFTPLAIEKKFVSRYGFAGIIDRVGIFKMPRWSGTQVVVDIKTGAVANHVAYQLVSYTMGAAEDDPNKASRIRRIALRLSDDGTYKVREFPLVTWGADWARFMSAVREVSERGENAA